MLYRKLKNAFAIQTLLFHQKTININTKRAKEIEMCVYGMCSFRVDVVVVSFRALVSQLAIMPCLRLFIAPHFK